jgi:hypothetical protein
MELSIDSNLNYSVQEEGCRPVVFMPDVDLYKLKDDSIINAF